MTLTDALETGRKELFTCLLREGASEEWLERVRKAGTVEELIAIDDEYMAFEIERRKSQQ